MEFRSQLVAITSMSAPAPPTNIATALVSILVYILLLSGTAHALNPNTHLTQYIHKAWRTQDGSLPAGMYHITQTSDGFLWFLSLPADIYRFDGVRFLPWHLPPGVPIDTSWNIFADRKGGLWVSGSHDIVRMDGLSVRSHFQVGAGMFQGVAETPDGSLWVLNDNPGSPLCHVTDSLKCFGSADGIPISRLESVLADGNGGFWLGGSGGGLVHWRAGTSETYTVTSEIFSMARGADGSVWLGLSTDRPGQGLQQLKDGVVKPFLIPPFNGSGFDIGALMFDHDGNLWVGTKAKGIFRIHGNAVEHFDRTNGLSGDSVYALFEDREGIVWAGTTSGVDSFRDPAIVTFSQAEGLGKDLPAGILASKDGTLWVANEGSLDHIVNGAVSSIRPSDGLPGEQVAAMLEDRAGNMWVGVDNGLFLFKDGRFRRLPEPDRQPLGMVFGITEDIDGNIWAECASKPSKLVRIRDFQVREVFPASKVPPGHNLAPDPKGGIWIVSSKGDLMLLRNGAVKETVSLPPRTSPINRKLVVEADGSIFVGTEKGLLEWRKGKVQQLTTKSGLPCDSVISFVEDSQNRWWLYTRCGVVEFPDSELQRWRANPDANVQNRLYDTFDGAQPNIGSFNQAASSPTGRVWFTSGVVVQMIDPSVLEKKQPPVPAYIESVIVDRKEFATTGNLALPPHSRDLQIDYTSPTFSIPQRVKFRYRLDNYDRDWHEAGTRRQAFYTDLPPGTYSFRVMAANSDGFWSDSPASLDFSVTPAYYQTNWFRALCAVLFLMLVWAIHRIRVRQLRHQFALTLETRVRERTSIARDLHDTLLQSGHGLLLRLQIISQLLPDRPLEAKEQIETTIDRTARAITEGRDAVQGLRASTVQTNALAQAINTLGEELAKEGGNAVTPEFRVTVEGESRDLHPILRDEIYRIAGEALRNAFRHAEAGRIEVEVRYDDQQFRLRVRDDGKGIDQAVLLRQGSYGHYGLPGMRERAKLAGADLAVWSEVGAGTEVELRLPAATAYAVSGKRSWLSELLARR